MKKYFITSDIHSFYTPLIVALEKNEFDINNPEHILVVLGDVFDRGNETLDVYYFLTTTLSEDRIILIRGNHELLYLDLLKKDFPDSYDFNNGTVRTFCQIARYGEEALSWKYWFMLGEEEPYERIHQTWKEIVKEVKNSEITKWIQGKQWINYLETNKYIMVHSWIPTTQVYYKGYIQEVDYREDWRNATATEWADATWGCPWKKALLGFNKTTKTIVCGHWHTSDFFNNLTKQKKDEYDCPLFKSKKYKLIGLDACTVASNKINILVLNEDEL